MINITFSILIFSLIPLAMLSTNKFLSNKFFSREKKSPFECGFDPMSPSRMPMSTQFFLTGLVFLIFDVEITLLFPLVFMFSKLNLPLIFSSFLFILILIIGLFIELIDRTIDWKT